MQALVKTPTADPLPIVRGVSYDHDAESGRGLHVVVAGLLDPGLVVLLARLRGQNLAQGCDQRRQSGRVNRHAIFVALDVAPAVSPPAKAVAALVAVGGDGLSRLPDQLTDLA